MKFEAKLKYKPILMMYPKAKPLAQTLIAAAAEQGASMNELELACKLALEAYREALDNTNASLAEFQSKAESSIDGL